MKHKHLIPLMEESIVRDFERGQRRYFPLKRKKMCKGALANAFFILYGRNPEKGEVGMAILFYSIDRYIEKFDDQLWVRTIAL